MSSNRGVSPWVIGLALFSMFFGSGNLIFPLYMGQIGQGQWLPAIGGFLSTAVLLPFCGVLIMVLFEGDYRRFFAILGRRPGFLLTALLLTVWIPLGSGPRCIALSYASLATYVPMPSLWMFSLLYSLVLFSVVRHKQRMLQILGRYLTPCLLLCLGAVIFRGVLGYSLPEGEGASEIWVRGVLEGYNTMDLIAAVFFSASVIRLFKDRADNPVRLVLKASILGMSLLAVVYVGLVYLAAVHHELLEGVAKEKLLAELARLSLGPVFGGIAAVAIALACFTTSVALANVYADFLSLSVFQDSGRSGRGVWVTLAVTFVMSIFGLQGITAVTAPVLEVCYPILLLLIVLNAGREWLKSRVDRESDLSVS